MTTGRKDRVAARSVQTPGDITEALAAWQAGDEGAADALVELIRPELHQIARGLLSMERQDHTLQPTALLHEAYLRLADQKRIRWQDRHQFFAVAARMVQRTLVDHARRRQALKRGGDRLRVPLDEVGDLATERPELLIALDSALSALERREPQQATIVRSRFFGGLTHEQIAEILGCSRTTVKRQWRMAKAWLFRELSQTV